MYDSKGYKKNKRHFMKTNVYLVLYAYMYFLGCINANSGTMMYLT